MGKVSKWMENGFFFYFEYHSMTSERKKNVKAKSLLVCIWTQLIQVQSQNWSFSIQQKKKYRRTMWKKETNRIISQNHCDQLKIKCGLYGMNNGQTIELYIVFLCVCLNNNDFQPTSLHTQLRSIFNILSNTTPMFTFRAKSKRQFFVLFYIWNYSEIDFNQSKR